ncbi:MAG: ferric reductase-like transmembrane domain-containing protein [bacterium]|nr:ferric reductase-like transmembrane domain-containing protein [bacterium]
MPTQETSPKKSTPGNLRNSHYPAAATITMAVIVFWYAYAAIRYGTGGMSTLNKSLATSTLFLLGFVLLLGPLSRGFRLFDRFVQYRKELGILGVFTAGTHVYMSMFPLARNGPFGFYLARPLSAYAGLAGLFLMAGLLALSADAVRKKFDSRVWWKMQNWGIRAAFLSIGLHVVALKYSGWPAWFATHGAEIKEGVAGLPPISLLSSVFVALVVAVRLGELLGTSKSRIITYLSFGTAMVYTLWLFVF